MLKQIFSNQITNFMTQSTSQNFRKSERYHEQSIELLIKFYENKVKPNSILKEVKQEILDYNVRPEILRFAIMITKKFFVSKNDVEKKFYLKQLHTFNQYQYAFLSALNINFNINLLINASKNVRGSISSGVIYGVSSSSTKIQTDINIKHITKKLFHKKNAEKLAINIIRTIMITITKLCLLTNDELYELNIENSIANKLVTNLVLFLLNSNLLINKNYFAITNLSTSINNDLTNMQATKTIMNTRIHAQLSANIAASSSINNLNSSMIKTKVIDESKLIIETIVKPTFEIILNLSEHYYDLLIKCSKYLKEFIYLLNNYKINNKSLFFNLTFILQITSLAYNRILNDEQFVMCFERAKEIYYKSKIKEINEKFCAQIQKAKLEIEKCKKDVELAKRTLRKRSQFYRSNSMIDGGIKGTNSTIASAAASNMIPVSASFTRTTTSTSIVSNEVLNWSKCQENLEKAENYLKKLYIKRENLKKKLKINIKHQVYKEKIIPFLNGYHGTTLLTWDFVHSFIFNSYHTVCIHLINIIYKLIIQKFHKQSYKYKLANLWKLLINAFIIRIQASKMTQTPQKLMNDYYAFIHVNDTIQEQHQHQHQATTMNNYNYYLQQQHQYQHPYQQQLMQPIMTHSEYDEISLNVDLLNEIESYKKFHKINYYDKFLITNCIDYFMKMRENNDHFY